MLVKERQEGLEYFVEHHKGSLLILTNMGGALNNCLVSASIKSGTIGWAFALIPCLLSRCKPQR